MLVLRPKGPMEPDAGPGPGRRPRSALRACGGILKSATISFGQALDPAVLAGAEEAAADCDLLLAVGLHPQRLSRPPAWCRWPTATAAAVVIVNAQPTPFDDLAAAVVRGSISEVLPALVTPELAQS